MNAPHRYNIVRFYQDDKKPEHEIIKSGLVLLEALGHVRKNGGRGIDEAGRPFCDGFVSEEIQ